MLTFTVPTRIIALTFKAIALLSLIGLGGCSSMGIEPWVKPYERQNLADPIMR